MITRTISKGLLAAVVFVFQGQAGMPQFVLNESTNDRAPNILSVPRTLPPNPWGPQVFETKVVYTNMGGEANAEVFIHFDNWPSPVNSCRIHANVLEQGQDTRRIGLEPDEGGDPDEWIYLASSIGETVQQNSHCPALQGALEHCLGRQQSDCPDRG